MTKVIPFWEKSAQPGITYYMKKVSHDFIEIIDHCDESKHVVIFDERIGPKNIDYKVSMLTHYIKHSGLIPLWVRRACISTSTNKNRYLIG